MAGFVMTVRVDRWLWAARFFKNRGLASEAVKAGHIELNGLRSKPAKAVKIGDTLRIKRGLDVYTVVVLGLAEKRGSAVIAQALYQESEQSVQARSLLREQQKILAMSSGPEKRPDKKARRQIIRFQSSS
ncbi:MAG: S4 domain-containing protein [Mariprofundaceae bacterium]